MATVYDDIIEGISGAKDGIGTKQIPRSIIVTGLDASHSVQQRVIDAWTATGLTVGNAHPVIPYAFLQDYTYDVLDPKIIKLNLNYTRTGKTEGVQTDGITVSATCQEIETSRGVPAGGGNEEDMSLSHTYPVGEWSPTKGAELTAADKCTQEPVVQGVVLSKNTPLVSWGSPAIGEYTKAELITLCTTYVGKTNTAVWNGLAARSVLCTNIDASSIGKVYTGNTRMKCKLIYNYQYNPYLYDREVVFLKDDGKPPAVLDANNRKKYRVLGEVSYTSLPF